MKKYLVTSCVFMGVGLALGVFFREFTKIYDFSGVTSLGKLHLHALVLGMVFFLLAAFAEDKFGLRKSKLEPWFFVTYIVGLSIFLVMLLVRGIFQVTGAELTAGASGAISGIAGIGHILIAAGLILFFIIILRNCKPAEKTSEE
ncbi:MAG: DUF2871 domain-containing protein [Candidatus Coproplasma sp.]